MAIDRVFVLFVLEILIQLRYCTVDVPETEKVSYFWRTHERWSVIILHAVLSPYRRSFQVEELDHVGQSKRTGLLWEQEYMLSFILYASSEAVHG